MLHRPTRGPVMMHGEPLPTESRDATAASVPPPRRPRMPFERRPQPPIRSLLYVPGNKLDWMMKASKYGADALIFDLEDAVPDDQKVASRAIIRQALEQLAGRQRPRLFVRVNRVPTGLTE